MLHKLSTRRARFALRARQLGFLLTQVERVRDRLNLAARGVGFYLAPNLLRKIPGLATVRVRFRHFDLEFKLGQGEILSYEPIVQDLRMGIIPTGPALETWTVVDCGANIGLFSLFLKGARRIVAIEPNPDCCARLRRNLDSNAVPATVIQKAVTAEPGTVRMDFFGIFSRISEAGSAEVEGTTLDAIFDQQGLKRVDLLKLDVEGHGFEALEGARRAFDNRVIQRLYAEFITPEELREFDSFLVRSGFARVRTGDVNALYQLAPQLEHGARQAAASAPGSG